MSATILVTGFETFGPHETNPTEAAMSLLPEEIGAARIVTAVLPVEFGRCGEEAVRLVEEHVPQAVVLTGVAGGRPEITPERIAVNVRDTGGEESFADNAGYAPIDVPIREGGPDGIFATLPNRAIVATLKAAGIPAALSSTAGTYICNETMYAVLDALAASAPPEVPAGFIHVPTVAEMPLETIVRGLEVAIEVVAAEFV